MTHGMPADSGFLLRIADGEPVDEDLLRQIDRGDDLIPSTVWPKLRHAFTPRGMPFFEFYIQLRRVSLGEPVAEDLRRKYVTAINHIIQVTSPVDHEPLSPMIVNEIADSRTEMNTMLGRLMGGKTDDSSTWRRINNIYVPLIIAAAQDKGIYMSVRQLGTERWGTFRRMSPRQEKIEKLRLDNPETFALVTKYRKTLSEIDQGIRKRIEDAGLEVHEQFVMGRPTLYGRDPTTGEDRVYDLDGDVLTHDEYIAKRKANIEAGLKIARVPSRTDVPLKDMRSLPDNYVDGLQGDVEWASISDDKAKQGRLTRIFATKNKSMVVVDSRGEAKVESYRVIASGRYKGIYLDDMVNSQGRMIEGTAYTYSPITGRSTKVPHRIDPAQREPYVSTAEVTTTRRVQGKITKRKTTRLFLKIPGTRQYSALRDAMKSLSCNSQSWYSKRGCIPSVTWVPIEGSNAAAFYFDPKDFGVVMDTLQGMSLSSSALELVQSYYRDLAHAEQAASKDNLAHYSMAAIGGFKTVRKNPQTGELRAPELLTKQKQALAWLDANGNRGVCGLDTGIGKTVLSVAMMQKLDRDGLTEPDASYMGPQGQEIKTNGRFLYVCPKDLKGNAASNVYAFIAEAAQQDVLGRIDEISYREFSGATKTGKTPRSLRGVPFWKDRPWDPRLYVAIFFDEAQALTSFKSGPSQAALKLWHPRKICLTASPMEKSPMEAYVLGAITNNIPLFGRSPEATQNRKEMRRFKERYCEVVGNRIIGVKQDPTIKRDLQVWIKRNIFYADKTDVEEYHLPELKQETRIVEMPTVVETAYRSVTDQFAKMMGGMVAKFRDRANNPDGPSAKDKEVERIFTNAFVPVVQMLNALANYPEVALTDIATMIERNEWPYPGPDGAPKPIPVALQRVVQTWAKAMTPDQLRDAATGVGNPKLQSAEEYIRSKVDRTHGSSRSLLFSDDKRLCMMAARHMAKTIAGRHAVALDDSLYIFDGSQTVPEIVFDVPQDVLDKLIRGPEDQAKWMANNGGRSVIPLPLGKHPYRKFPNLPARDPINHHYKASDWQQFALQVIVNPDPGIRSCTLLGRSYQYGHNLQAFDTVIHLDRDTWNSESMKQRTARAWRQGQTNPVDEVTIDATYAASVDGTPRNDFDRTLDEVRGYFQQMGNDIFDRIIRDSQVVQLGSEWGAIQQANASTFRLDRKVVELMLSPYVQRSEPPGASS